MNIRATRLRNLQNNAREEDDRMCATKNPKANRTPVLVFSARSKIRIYYIINGGGGGGGGGSGE